MATRPRNVGPKYYFGPRLDGPLPAYDDLARTLRAAILARELTGRLPSLDAMAARYDVTRDVARRAVEILRGEGLVVSYQGKGSYVQTFERIIRRSPSRLSGEQWVAGAQIQDADTAGRLRTADVVVGEVPVPDYAAEALKLAPDTPVLSRSRRFIVDGRPVQLAVSYLPLDVVHDSRIMYTDSGPGGIYARLAELGHAPVRFSERLTARAPRPEEVERLELASAIGALVFEVTRFAYSAPGRCVEVNRMILDATAYELVYDFTA
jgi:GntR family transcriptional regulator